MSDPLEPLPPPLPPSPPSGCAAAFVIIFGLILLLPGLCALIIGVGALKEGGFDPYLIAWVLVGLLVGFLGILLIRAGTSGT